MRLPLRLLHVREHDLPAKKELLTLEELDRMCSTFIGMGVEKLRITGGEPLVRRDIMTFFNAMGRHLDSGALKELTLTTNGSQLEKHAQNLFDAGVRRVNVSLDTLDEQRFADVTRWGRLPQVMRGIDAAQAAGLQDQDQRGRAQRLQRRRAVFHDRVVRQPWDRPHLD